HSTYIEGFAIISISFMLDVVVDPFRVLKGLVLKRTEELAESKQESEYYLSIWSHKVGNLLQGLQLYLELLESSSDEQEITKLSQSSLMLVKDVESINRQVSILSRIKGRQTEDLFPVSMNDAIKAAICEINDILGDSEAEITFSEFKQDDHVLGDELLSTVPFNIIMYIIRDQTPGKPKISVSLSESPDYLTVNIQYDGKHISEDVLTALYDSFDPSKTTMGLDLYAAKVLLKDYGGTFTHEESPNGGQFIASIKRYLVERSDGNHVELHKTIDT
ncbi:MAG: sensor histidine kinase, partial [Promethearchaeota archaeon]